MNAERQNGRAAMMGITGVLIHELLGVDGLYPTGERGGDAPRPSSRTFSARRHRHVVGPSSRLKACSASTSIIV